MKLKGKVVEGDFARGSKSEHKAVYLDTGKKKYKLKRKGGHPFYDETLNLLVGKTIEAEGMINSYIFVMTDEPKEITD